MIDPLPAKRPTAAESLAALEGIPERVSPFKRFLRRLLPNE